jgi:tyrosyl-DNA phosphodiesterase-1
MFILSSTDPQGSSLGTYGIDWIDTFYKLCCGKTLRSLIGKAKPTGFPPIKIVFPSLATVEASEVGREVSAQRLDIRNAARKR